jgi:Winged helix-turn-helix DNA-binding
MIPEAKIPDDILKDSVLAHLAAAYFAVGKRLERKTGCSATRGSILSTLGHDAALNQNQVAKRLGFDRTVVHRAIKTILKEGLVAERKLKLGEHCCFTSRPKEKNTTRLSLSTVAVPTRKYDKRLQQMNVRL